MSGDQLEPIYNNFVLIQDVAWKTCRERWTIETNGEKGSWESVLAARHDGDDDGTLIGTSITFTTTIAVTWVVVFQKEVIHDIN